MADYTSTHTGPEIDTSVDVTQSLTAGTLYASQAEAEAGTSESTLMNPLRTKQAIDALASAVEPGSIAYIAASSAPGGWLKCNGAAISRTAYAALFAAISTVFGAGDGSTTFNLPDLRGEFVRGWDDSRGVDSGRALGSAQADDLRSHNHAIALSKHTTGYAGQEPAQPINSGSMSTANTGGTETRPRNIALLACIKY